MKFIVEYRLQPATHLDSMKRFAETQGPPPTGITTHARWHAAGGHRGFTYAETDDMKALYAWVLNWADLLSFEVIPVLDDAEVTEVLTAHFKA